MTTTGTAEVDFVLGGKILNRSIPPLLQPNNYDTQLLIRSPQQKRMLTEDEWEQFCRDVEASMSWSNHWRNFLFSKAVVITSTLTLISLGTLIAWSMLLKSRLSTAEEQSAFYNETHLQNTEDGSRNSTNVTSFYLQHHGRHSHEYYEYTDDNNDNNNQQVPSISGIYVFFENILPDLCIIMILVSAIAMTVSLLRLSMELQESVKAICEEYTRRYLPYHGITFSVQQKEVQVLQRQHHPQGNFTMASPASHPTAALQHSRQGAHATMASRKKFRPYILISRSDDDDQGRSYQQSTNTNNNNLHPSYQVGAAPFFDVQAPTHHHAHAGSTLLPPSNKSRFAGILLQPPTLPEP